MIKLSIQNLLLLLALLLLGSCSNRFIVKSYTVYLPACEWLDSSVYDQFIDQIGDEEVELLAKANRSIILIDDSTLNYSIRSGGIGWSASIRYKLSGQYLIVDSIDINNKTEFIDEDIFNHEFLYSRDSLVDIDNREKYFTDRYVDKKRSNAIK